jgi:N-acetylmuramic acid 6-phosphate etherase
MDNQRTKTTESSSLYNNLEQMSALEILTNINREDQKVALAIEKILPSIEAIVEAIYTRMNDSGRLFYIGAGTSGRLGVVDASECPPTYGVPFDMVVGIIAGGDGAIRKAVEFAEDDKAQAWKDLSEYNITSKDFVIGIAASGSTPYVYGGLEACKQNGIGTGCISCNELASIKEVSDFPIVAVVGPEFVTGSTRMKAGTAQKLILNMISTSVMIKLGKVKGNKMVDMQLTNDKLIDRGVKMIMSEIPVEYDVAKKMLDKYGSVRAAVDSFNS